MSTHPESLTAIKLLTRPNGYVTMPPKNCMGRKNSNKQNAMVNLLEENKQLTTEVNFIPLQESMRHHNTSLQYLKAFGLQLY